jgi:hypothetical protein
MDSFSKDFNGNLQCRQTTDAGTYMAECGLRAALYADGLQIFSANLNGRVLVDGFKTQYKAVTVAAANQGSLHALQYAALDANLFADDKVAVRLDQAGSDAGSEGLDVGIGYGDTLASVADDLEHSGRLEDAYALTVMDVDEEVGGKERQDSLDALPVLPDADGFVGWQEGLDLAHAKVADDGFFVLGHGKDGEPAALSGMT